MSRPSILNSLERKSILFLGDLFIVIASLNYLINHAIDREFISISLEFWTYLTGIIIFFVLAYILDFYNLEKVYNRRYAFSHSLYVTFLFVFLIFLFTVIAFDTSFWRFPLIVFLFLTPLEIGLWRILYSNLFRIIPIVKNVLYIYDDIADQNLKNDLAAINGKEMNTFYRVKLTYRLSITSNDLKKTLVKASRKIDAFIVNTKDYNHLPEKLEELLLESMISGKEVISFTTFYENIYEALPITSHNDSFYEILQLRNKRIRYLQRLFSIVINVGLSVLIGLLLLLLIPFIWFFNLFLNRGPLFYSQNRVGRYGKEFKIYKFRSMVENAEQHGAKMATKNDSRITPFGKVLRMFRIDELPQVLSIIKGDMQFIGPRPERKVFVDELNSLLPFYNVRHLIKPGVTGWAQVKYKYGENLEDSIKKLEYDLYYIKNKSISLDLRIILKTVTTVVFSRGI